MSPTNTNIVCLVLVKGALERALSSSSAQLKFLEGLAEEVRRENLIIDGGKALRVEGTWEPVSGSEFVDVRLAQDYFSRKERCRKAQVFLKNVPNGKWCVRKFHPNGRIEMTQELTKLKARIEAFEFVKGPSRKTNASKHKKKRS